MTLTQAYTDTARGRLDFGSVLVGYATLITVEGSVRKLQIFNTLDADVTISLNGGTTDFIDLPAGRDLKIDFDNTMHFTGVVQVKRVSGAPTAGFITAGVIKGQ